MGPPSATLVSQFLMICRRVRDAVRLQRIVHVVALRPLARQAAEIRPAERVAASLRNDVELRPAAIGLAEPARYRELHFLRVRRVVAVARHAAAVERRADVHAVDLDSALVAATTARGEEDHRRVDAAVLNAVGLNARHGREQIPVATRGRQRRQDLVAEDPLDAQAVLHVHHRRFTRDGDRLLHTAQAHVRVERQGHTSRDLDTRTLDGGETGQGVGDLVDPGREVLDAVLAGAVADGRPDLLDEHWARCLDRHAG